MKLEVGKRDANPYKPGDTVYLAEMVTVDGKRRVIVGPTTVAKPFGAHDVILAVRFLDRKHVPVRDCFTSAVDAVDALRARLQQYADSTQRELDGINRDLVVASTHLQAIAQKDAR